MTNRRTDEMARKLINLYNRSEFDSIYALTNQVFRNAIAKDAFVQSMKTQLQPLGTIAGFGQAQRANGVSRYKCIMSSGLNLQMLVALDAEDKVSTWAMRPWQEKPTTERTNIWNDNAMATSLDSLVNKIAADYMKTHFTPGLSIGILQGTKASTYNYGFARVETEQHPTRQTLYEIGSITKTFTAFVLADAVVNNKAKLDDPITKYLPDSVASNIKLQQIKLVHLSNHTSGLPRLPANLLEGSTKFNNPYAYYDNPKLFKFLKTVQPVRSPGIEYEYSNLAVGLLGVIMERVYAKPIQQLYDELIFKPLKMNNTFCGPIPDTTMAAAPYTDKAQPTNYWNFISLAAAGSIKSTTEDMLRYALYFTMKPRQKGKPHPRLALLDSITYAKAPQYLSLGWLWDKDTGSNRIMQHSGGTGGFRSNISVIPDRKLAIVVLANCAEEPGAPLVAELLRKELLIQ